MAKDDAFIIARAKGEYKREAWSQRGSSIRPIKWIVHNLCRFPLRSRQIHTIKYQGLQVCSSGSTRPILIRFGDHLYHAMPNYNNSCLDSCLDSCLLYLKRDRYLEEMLLVLSNTPISKHSCLCLNSCSNIPVNKCSQNYMLKFM